MAYSWLDEGNDDSFRNVDEPESNEKSLDLIREIYDAGAVEVIAVDIDKDADGEENTGKLLIVLPEQPAQRKSVLESRK